MKTINQDKLNQKLAERILAKSKAIADAMQLLLEDKDIMRLQKNKLALRTLQLVKTDRSEASIKLKQDRANKGRN